MTARTLLGPLGVSLLAIVICLIVVFVQVPPLAAALVSPSAAEDNPGDKITSLIAMHEEEAETFERRFDGRSAFYPPPRPQVPRRETPREEQRQPDPETRPAPATYGGGLTANSSLGDVVIFKQGTRDVMLRAGETANDTRIVSINAPWSVTVAWTKPAEGHISYEEGEYELRFWASLESGPNASLLAEAPPAGARTRGLEEAGAAAQREGLGTPTTPGTNRRPNRDATERRRFDDDEEDPEDDEDYEGD